MRRFDIVLSDILEIIRRKRKAIILYALVFSFLALFYGLSQDILYAAEATFRDKGKASVGMRQSMSDLLMGGGSEKQDSETVSVMKSARLMEALVKNLDRQGSISEKKPAPTLFETIVNNLTVEWAYFNRSKVPSLPDREKEIAIKNVQYAGEKRYTTEISFQDDQNFTTTEGQEGKIGQPFVLDDVSFTLIPKNTLSFAGRTFIVTLFPLKHSAKDLATILSAKVDPDDRGLIRIRYLHPDRHEGPAFVNELMLTYQNYLGEEHNRIAEAQLDYLKKREEEIAGSLKSVMAEHANRVKTDLSSSGFTDSRKEMEFLSMQLVSSSQKLMQIRLDEKRLEKVLAGEVASFDQYSPGAADAAIINDMLNRMRELKTTQDSLDLALEDDRNVTTEEDFKHELAQLKRLKGCCEEAVALLEGKSNSNIQYLNNPKYLLDVWQKLLKNREIEESQFDLYLEGLRHLIQMQIRAIEERLHHRLRAPLDYQGITLGSAKEIYFSLSRDRQENEATIKQLDFVVKQLEDPEFEITSLTSVLKDPVSHEKIMKASGLSHALKDTGNRTAREIERIKEELRVQKEFLKLHLSETVKLLDLKGNVLSDKSLQLQGAMLEMAGREVTVLEKQLYDYITTRLYNLQIEKRMIEDQQNELKAQLAAIPDKWMHEQLLEQHLQRNQKMVESITSMVESKNISNNLELVQSAPLDWAVVPLHPKHPRLILLSILGAFLGAFFSSLFFVSKGLLSSVPLTQNNLSLNGFKTLGFLTYKKKDKALPHFDSNLDALRRAVAFIPAEKRSILTVFGKGVDFSELLCELYRKKGLKVVRLDLSFRVSDKPGIKQYLNDEKSIDAIITEDTIVGGGLDRFSNELLGQEKFRMLLKSLGERYDRVVAVSPAALNSAQTHALLTIFEAALLAFTDETLSESNDLLRELQDENPHRVVGFFQNKQI